MIIKSNDSIHRDIIVEIDEYIPFNIKFNPTDPYSLFYWRCENGPRSLVEVGIEMGSGIISSITLVSIDLKKVIYTDKPLLVEKKEYSGIPEFDISFWEGVDLANYKERFKDESSSDLELIVGNDYFSLRLKDINELDHYIGTGSVRFGVTSASHLVSIDVRDLRAEEIAKFKNSL